MAEHDDLSKNLAPIAIGRAKSILGLLIIGAFGSGLWEIFLRDIFFALGNITLNLISAIWVGYVDLLHQGIGKLRGDLLVIPIFAVVATAVTIGPLILSAHLWREFKTLESQLKPLKPKKINHQETIDSRLKRIRQKIIWQIAPLSCVFVVFFTIQIWQIHYTRNASTWAEQSIEILAPHIGIEETLLLRSKLRSVEKAVHFYKLEEKIKSHALNKSIDLPKFNSIGKQNK